MPTHFQGSPEQVRALETFIKLVRATETLNARLQSSLAEEGLTLGQMGVLEALLHLGPMCQRALGKKLLRSDANVTTVLDNLERAGLIRRARSAQDRRLVNVELTGQGRDLIGRVFPGHVRLIAESLSTLSAAEQKELARLCKKLGLSLAA
jgi:MarR family 2-MHQ and catechol resistance regulon transcriptional repressor